MRKLTIPRVVAALLFISVTGAEGAEAERQWFSTEGKITRIGTALAEDGLFLTLDVPTKNNGCKVPTILFMARTSKQYQETLSIALLSFAQARPIWVFHDGTCSGGAVSLFAVSIETNP